MYDEDNMNEKEELARSGELQKAINESMAAIEEEREERLAGRTKTLQVRISDTDYFDLVNDAKKSGVSLSEHIRCLLFPLRENNKRPRV